MIDSPNNPAANTAALIRRLLQADEGFAAAPHSPLLQAGKLLGAHPGIDDNTATAVLEQLLNLLLNTPVIALRTKVGRVVYGLLNTTLQDAIVAQLLSAALEARGDWGLRELTKHPAVRSTLLPLLSVGPPDVRRGVIRALEVVADEPQVQQALLETLTADNWLVRWAALVALAPYTERDVVATGLQARLHDPDCNVFKAAARILGNHHQRSVQQALLTRLDDPSACIREHAAGVLLAWAADKLLNTARRLAEQSDPQLRQMAAAALKRVASNEAAVTILLTLLGDPAERVRAAAAASLVTAATRPAVQQALLTAYDDASSTVRRHALDALELAVGNPLVEARLLEDVYSKSVNSVYNSRSVAAARILARGATTTGGTNVPGTINWPLLQTLLRNSEYFVREAGVAALVKHVADSTVIATLLPMLNDQSDYVRAAAVEALRPAIADPHVRSAVYATLSTELKSDNSNIRRRVAHSLDYRLNTLVGDTVVQDWLIALLDDPAGIIRLHALSALEKGAQVRIKSDPALQAQLLRLLDDEDHYVRQHAVQALTLGPRSAELYQALRPLLNDPQIAVRQSAAWILSEVDNSLAVQRLVVALLGRYNSGELPPRLRQAVLILAQSTAGRQVLSDQLATPLRAATARALALVPAHADLQTALMALLDDWRVADTAHTTLISWTIAASE